MVVSCDESLGVVGKPCSHNDNYACAVDGSAQLTCADYKWVLSSYCRGPNKCAAQDPHIHCDRTMAKVGDPCEPQSAACSLGGFAVLECADGKHAVKRQCKTNCEIRNKLVQCARR